MAFTNFYLIGGGTGSADINAGSSIGAAQAAATTGGAWVGATNTFTAVSGTPFASTVAGDYASVYVDGGTVTTYIAKVSSVTSNKIIVLDATIKYGTVPSDGAANRSCVINGSWNTEQVLAAGGLATTTVPQSTKINIKGNLTLTASRAFSMAGAATTPLWFSGYTTTPGDLDADTTNTLAKPIWALNSTFQLSCTGNFQTWTGISVTGSRSGTIWNLQGSPCFVDRVRSENTSSNAAAIALTWAVSQGVCGYSWFKTPTTATTTGTISVGGNGSFIGCVAEGGGLAGWNGAANNYSLINCIALNNTGAGVLSSTGQVKIMGLTVLSSGGTVDGVKWTGTPGSLCWVMNLLCVGQSGGTAITNGINNASGTNTQNVFRACNDYSNVTNAEVGFGDSPAFFGQTESAFPLTSATNLTPLRTSSAIAHGFPGVFENQTFSSFVALGAVDPTANPIGFFLQ